jgi:hypothetical protein
MVGDQALSNFHFRVAARNHLNYQGERLSRMIAKMTIVKEKGHKYTGVAGKAQRQGNLCTGDYR